MQRRGYLAALLVGLLVAALAAPAAATNHSKIRAFHNSPDTPAVDIYVNGDKVLSDVTYGTLSGYIQVPRGRHLVEVKVAPSDASDAAALAREVNVGARPRTIAAIGSLTGDGEALRLKGFRDWRMVKDNVSRVRVAHTSPDAPAVNVQARVDGRYRNVITNLEFAQASRYLRLPAGTYDLRVVAAADPSVIVADLPGTQLPGGTAVTAWAVGFLTPGDGQPGFDITVTVDG
jgi:hypothetical protein